MFYIVDVAFNVLGPLLMPSLIAIDNELAGVVNDMNRLLVRGQMVIVRTFLVGQFVHHYVDNLLYFSDISRA